MKKSSLSPRQDWNAALDNNTGYYYFYHRVTGETTWKKPDDFKEWQEVLSINGDIIYYNVLRRTTARSSPLNTGLVEDRQDWKAVPDEKTGYYYFYNRVTRETTWRKPEMFEEWEPKYMGGKLYHYNVLTKEISRINPREIMKQGSSSKKEKGKKLEDSSKGKPKHVRGENNAAVVEQETILLKSLEKYCPDVLDNDLILRKLKGKEKQAIESIQYLKARLSSCPFDEVRESIASLLKLSIGIPSSSQEMNEADDHSFQLKQQERFNASTLTPLSTSERTKDPIIYIAGRNDLTIQYV